MKMIALTLTSDELIEVANQVAFGGHAALTEDEQDDGTQKAIRLAASVLTKIDEAYPELFDSEAFVAAREMTQLRRKTAPATDSQR